MSYEVDFTGTPDEVLIELDKFVEHEDTPTFRNPKFRDRLRASVLRMGPGPIRVVGECQDGRQHQLSIYPVPATEHQESP